MFQELLLQNINQKIQLIKITTEIILDISLKVLKDETIENVAENILTQEKSVAVIDANNKIVGSINPTKIINTVFGGRKKNN